MRSPNIHLSNVQNVYCKISRLVRYRCLRIGAGSSRPGLQGGIPGLSKRQQRRTNGWLSPGLQGRTHLRPIKKLSRFLCLFFCFWNILKFVFLYLSHQLLLNTSHQQKKTSARGASCASKTMIRFSAVLSYVTAAKRRSRRNEGLGTANWGVLNETNDFVRMKLQRLSCDQKRNTSSNKMLLPPDSTCYKKPDVFQLVMCYVSKSTYSNVYY